MAKDVINQTNNNVSNVMNQEGDKKKLIIGVSIGVVALIIVILLLSSFTDFSIGKDKRDEFGLLIDGKGSVTREFSTNQVSPGETFSIAYDVVLESEQRYYLFEDKIPDGFDILDCKHNSINKIKVIDIQSAESRVHNCAIKASSTPGTYTLEGVYAFEGLEDPVPLEGKAEIIVG